MKEYCYMGQQGQIKLLKYFNISCLKENFILINRSPLIVVALINNKKVTTVTDTAVPVL